MGGGTGVEDGERVANPPHTHTESPPPRQAYQLTAAVAILQPGRWDGMGDAAGGGGSPAAPALRPPKVALGKGGGGEEGVAPQKRDPP